jgi:flagellar motor switch protein FliN/FliY
MSNNPEEIEKENPSQFNQINQPSIIENSTAEDDLENDYFNQNEPLKKLPSNESIHSLSHELDTVLDIPVLLTVELGRTRMEIRELLQLSQGSIVQLGSTSGESLDILVNGCFVAQGEIVMVGDKLGIRLTEVITPIERMRKLNRI